MLTQQKIDTLLNRLKEKLSGKSAEVWAREAQLFLDKRPAWYPPQKNVLGIFSVTTKQKITLDTTSTSGTNVEIQPFVKRRFGTPTLQKEGILQMWKFLSPISTQEVSELADKEGFNHADINGLFAFALNYPTYAKNHHILACGSRKTQLGDKMVIPALCYDRDKCFIFPRYDNGTWDSGSVFLLQKAH